MNLQQRASHTQPLHEQHTMKKEKRITRWSRRASVCTAVASATLVGSPLMGKVVDSEIVFLVDVSGSIDQTKFNQQRDAYANAFRSADVLEAIQAGCEKGIAVTMVYWAGRGQQHTAVDWMLIDSQESANLFADAVSETTAPFSGRTAIGEAMTHATSLFGTETGNAGNGFESLYQVVNVSSNGVDNATLPRRRDRELNVEAARDGALAAGVDMINGIPIVTESPNLDSYYENHVIGGSIQGNAAEVFASNGSTDLSGVVKDEILHTINVGEHTHSVPEPASSSLLALGLVGFVFKRNRNDK